MHLVPGAADIAFKEAAQRSEVVAEVLRAARLFRDNALTERSIVVALSATVRPLRCKPAPLLGRSITTLDRSFRMAELLAQNMARRAGRREPASFLKRKRPGFWPGRIELRLA
jgi:hypothetical protein